MSGSPAGQQKEGNESADSSKKETEFSPWIFSTRVIAYQIPRATWRNTLVYRLNPYFSLGMEYNPLASDVHPLANLLINPETEEEPALIIGTSSDRIGTPDGQSYYATLSKSLEPQIDLPLAPYVGVAYGTFEDQVRPVAGLSADFTKDWSTLILYDGVNVHPTLSYSFGRHVISFILVKGHEPGFSYSISF